MSALLSEELLDKVHKYLGEHAGYHEQDNSTQQDAYAYHLTKMIISHITKQMVEKNKQIEKRKELNKCT